MAARSPVKRLHTSIVLSSAVGILSVGLIVAVASIHPLYEFLKKEEDRNLALALNTKTLAVEEYLTRAKDVAAQIAARTAARKKLEEYNAGRIGSAELVEITRESLLDAMNYSQEVWGISRLDKKGELVIQVGLEVPPPYWPVPEPASNEPGIYGPVSVGGHSLLVVRAPIVDRKSERVGTDVILFRLIHLQRIIEDHTGLGKSGETILGVAREDRIDLVFPLRNRGRAPSTLIQKDSPLGRMMGKAAVKKSGIFRPENPHDGEDVIAYGPVPNTSWGIAVKMEQEELYAPIKQQIFATSSIILGLILLGTLGMIMLVRPLSSKMIVHADELSRQVREKTVSLKVELNERKKMLQWFKDSERRYRTLLEEMPDVIFILDHEGCITFVNTEVENLLLYPVAQLLETRFPDYVAPEDKGRVADLFKLQAEAIWDEEIGVVDAQGAQKFTRIRCKALQSDEDGSMRYEGVMRDITRRRHLEEELKHSREELLEKIKIIDDLYEHIVQTGKSKAIADHTAEVAHELRQPLAIIGGFARRMARQLDACEITGGSGQKESCWIMIKEINRLERILDSLIDFTKHERIHLKRTDPNEIISQVLRVNEGRFGERNLRLKTNLGPEVGEIPLDPERFEQVIRNLVSNAIEASPSDGTVYVDTGVSIPSGKAQEAGGLESESFFEMKIKNSGRIIPAEELQKIFSPFFTTKDFGTGIGLTLSKKIMEEHHGSISVKSDEDGTVFTVWLPVQEPEISGQRFLDAAARSEGST